MSGCAAKTRSALFPASSMPGPDEPAWANAGLPCGERGSVSAPLTSKNRPWKSTGLIRSVSAQIPLSWSDRTAPASQLFHSRVTTSTNSSARA